MTLPSVLGCQVCSALEKQNVPKDKVFFGAKCASAGGGGTLSFVSYLQYGRISSSFSPQFIQPTQSTKVPFVLFSI